MPPVEIRPLVADDVQGASDTWLAAISGLRASLGLGARPAGRADRKRLGERIGHLLRTDPAGSWVAEDGGRIVGLAQSFVRESYWVLSLLGVDPSVQSSGVGGRLLQQALAHGDGLPGTIQASLDPRAIHLYAAAGFDAHPSMEAHGTIRRRVAWPEGVREGGVDELDVVAAIDRTVRGGCRTTDLAHLLDDGETVLLLDGERAYALAREGRIVTLAGRDRTAAERVLRAAMTRASGAFEIGWLTGRQQWAIRTAVTAGLSLRPRGPVLVRGMAGPPAPYLPSGGLG